MIELKRFGVFEGTLIIGDPHLGKRIYQKDDNLVFERLELALRGANEEYTRVIILGDLFDIPNPDFCTIIRFLEIIKKLPSNILVYILEGNHDQKKDMSKKRIFDIFSYLKFDNVTFVTSPLIIDSWDNNDKYLLLPYSDSAEAKELAISACHEIKKPYTLFAHLELDETNEYYVRDAKQVYSGHDHTPRMHNNICWVGSLTPLDKSQDKENKFFKTATLEEVLSGDYRENFVEVFVKKNELVPSEVYGKVKACRIIVVDEEEEDEIVQKKDTYLNPLQKFHIAIENKNLMETYNQIINFR